jgi:PKHD-type hydroxylase
VAFSPDECARIIELAREAELAPGGLVGGVAESRIRRAGLAWLDERAGAEWVTARLVRLVADLNREGPGFDLDEFAESAQVARYGAEDAGHFGWHSDIGRGAAASRRKLTVVVQLSDPAAYEGGELQTWGGAEPVTAPKGQGDALVFPSFLLHRVTPVTEGERWSLTIWAHGPAFR